MRHRLTVLALCALAAHTSIGGFCANGVKNKKLVDSDPTVFFIVKGKLYVCGSTAAESELRAHEDEDIVAANRNWEQLVH